MITLDHLTKRYGTYTAVNDVTFTAEPGRVTGFLGPNGAGKSTSMRIIVGLTPATSGSAKVNGTHYHDLTNPARVVGTLLDASAQHAGRSGREVLALGAFATGMPKSRVDELLNLVGLTEQESKRRVRNYSLGMRQRLGLAHALIGDPEILILDEPANGLDPAGIRWMRELLSHYASRGGTVLLSSHLLNEVELIADHIVMIGHGRIVAEGSPAQLGQSAESVVSSLDNERLGALLTAAGHKITGIRDGEITVVGQPVDIGRLALENQIVITGLRQAGGLEDTFLELTASTQRDASMNGVAA
ncbi:MAG TPA: ATP-binding cassette domain-containing protein [Candidatus Lumbricidophila sp.]|nr:ATP-binding cassette domain-containing protein [Candidatus Lumbricidophila sp.]